MRYGCLASLVLWAVLGVSWIQPALLPLLVVLVLVVIAVWAVMREPDWPLY